MRSVLIKTIAPGARIRVLVVDDSVVIRSLVTHALQEDGDLDVVGSASNGVVALERMEKLHPDAVTLDIEMPEMNGIEVLRRIRNDRNRPRVVMFSTLTERGAALTLEALAWGADDYVTKASNAGSLDRSMASLRTELIPKIKQFFQISRKTMVPPPAGRTPAPTQPVDRVAVRPQVLAIGVSTGGPTALAEIIPQFPADFSLPIVIVQHMPPLFTRFLAERLQASAHLKVSEAVDGTSVLKGHVLVAPGDYHMRLRRDAAGVVIQLDQSPPENSCRPAVDALFRSVADVYGAGTIATVLTGMGQDGMRGAQVLKAAGAYVIAQDEATSVVWGMPGSVVNAGLANTILPLDSIVPEVLRQVRLNPMAAMQ